MKIDRILHSGLESHEKKSIEKSRKVSGSAFERVLEEAKNSHQEGKTVSSVLEADLVRAPFAVNPFPLTENISQALITAEDTLSSLEKFGELLAKPDVRRNELAAVVGEMDDNARKLDELFGVLPKDSSLRPIVEQISALTAKEVAKFERGDYGL